MARAGLDACVLSSSGNVQYATGVNSVSSDPSHVIGEPTLAIVTQDEVRAFVSYPEGAPLSFPLHKCAGLFSWDFRRVL